MCDIQHENLKKKAKLFVSRIIYTQPIYEIKFHRNQWRESFGFFFIYTLNLMSFYKSNDFFSFLLVSNWIYQFRT